MNQDVKEAVYKAVADAAGADFAFSYLIKAKQRGTLITPHTFTAWKRLLGNKHAMQALYDSGVTLRKPEVWHPNRVAPAIHRQAA